MTCTADVIKVIHAKDMEIVYSYLFISHRLNPLRTVMTHAHGSLLSPQSHLRVIQGLTSLLNRPTFCKPIETSDREG